MDGRRALVVVSAAQLLAGIAGHVVAVRQRRPFDLPLLGQHGKPGEVARDSWLMGTALSPPIVMLVVHGAATARLAAAPDRAARAILGALGAMMVAGTLLERESLRAFTRAERSLVGIARVVVGVAPCAAMAVLGLRPAARRAPTSRLA